MDPVFHCCLEYIQITAAYSNAVLVAVLPYVSDFARKQQLAVPVPLTTNQVERFVPDPYRGQIGGGLKLKNGMLFGFQEGHVFVYESTNTFFNLQNPDDIPHFYGPLRMTKAEALELARESILKTGCSLEDVLAELEPKIELAQGIGTNVVPHYLITWMDPRGGESTRVEINANRKVCESMRFIGRVTLHRPGPDVDVEPGKLPVDHPWRALNEMGNDFNRDYARQLVPFVFASIEDWKKRLQLTLESPVAPNSNRRFYISDQGGWPHAEITLTNGWQFTFRNRGVTHAGSPRRFFDSDDLPFRIKDYRGKWHLSEDQAIERARREVAKLGFPSKFVHTETKPHIFRPAAIKGCPPIPRLQIEWNYPDLDHREQWIKVEVDCDRGSVEALTFDDISFWGQGPAINVPISQTKPSEESE